MGFAPMFFRLRSGYTEVNLNGKKLTVQRFLRYTYTVVASFQGSWEQGYIYCDTLWYSGTPLNGHPSTADTHNTCISDNSESPDCPSINSNTSATPEQRIPSIYQTIPNVLTVLPLISILQQPLNSGHPGIPYNGQFSVIPHKQYLNNPDLVDTCQPFQQDCPLSLLELTYWH